jgi:hypothetical protein
MEGLMSEFLSSLRRLRGSPSHTAAVVLSVAVGMAVCVAVFSLTNTRVFEAGDRVS